MEVVSLEQMEMKQGNDYEENQQQQKQKQKQLQLQQQQHFHVLAVDDSLIDRKLLEKLLTISSYHVTCVESGDKALEYLGLLDGRDNDTTSSSSPSSPSFSSSSSSFSSSSSANSTQQEMQGLKVNLIMTDYCMPGMSGYDLLKRVKGSSWKDVPVVVMSSENVPSRINMCLEGGAEDFLLKPVQLSDLKKLQPHLLKSLSQFPCENISSTSSTNEDDESINKNNNSSCSSCSSSKISNNGVCKRKALVSADPLERRSKLKD